MQTPNFLDTTDENNEINDIVILYNTRKRKSMNPSPYSLFFINEGKNVVLSMVEKSKVKPTPEKVIEQLNFEWGRLPNQRRNIYIKASIKLGFTPRNTDFIKNRISNIKFPFGF